VCVKPMEGRPLCISPTFAINIIRLGAQEVFKRKTAVRNLVKKMLRAAVVSEQPQAPLTLESRRREMGTSYEIGLKRQAFQV